MSVPVEASVHLKDDVYQAMLRRGVYAVLIALAMGNLVARILAVNSVDLVRLEQNLQDREFKERADKLKAAGEPVDEEALREQVRNEIRRQRPFLSANDRSRWTTVRALVERGTYAIDEVIAEPNWDTIDMVKHQDLEGNWRLYSSKPPLLATLVAAEYWLIHHSTGKTLGTHPYEIGRFMLITINGGLMLVYFFVLSKMLERFGRTDWGRIFVMAAGSLGTFLTTVAVSLNNHTFAAVSALVTLYAAARIWYDGDTRGRYFFLAGFFAAFTVTNELPALSLFGLVGLGLLWRHPKQALLFGVPGAAVVAAAFFGTNYLAHGSWRMPYAHRGDGPRLFQFVPDESGELDEMIRQLDGGFLPKQLEDEFNEQGHWASDYSNLRKKTEHLANGDERRWVVENSGKDPWYMIRLEKGADAYGTRLFSVHAFDDWYDYEYIRATDGRLIQSYWRDPKGIDKGEPNLGKYALHVLIGHHGIFSLTPVWLLMIPGVVILARSPRYRYLALAVLIAVLTVVCVTFYILRPPLDRNYGGMTSGFRWVYWLAPLWLVAVLPAADWMSATRLRRGIACLLLVSSVISVAYPTWNPWTLPWLTNFWVYMGWEKF